MELRRGTADDFEAVLAFWAHATTVPSETDDVDGLGTLLTRAPESLILAVDGGEIVGTVIAGFDGWRAAMYRIAVRPDYRRHGLGRTLVGEAERVLCEQGARRFHMIVQPGEAPANAFWAGVGYERTDQYRYVKTLTPG